MQSRPITSVATSLCEIVGLAIFESIGANNGERDFIRKGDGNLSSDDFDHWLNYAYVLVHHRKQWQREGRTCERCATAFCPASQEADMAAIAAKLPWRL